MDYNWQKYIYRSLKEGSSRNFDDVTKKLDAKDSCDRFICRLARSRCGKPKKSKSSTASITKKTKPKLS